MRRRWQPIEDNRLKANELEIGGCAVRNQTSMAIITKAIINKWT